MGYLIECRMPSCLWRTRHPESYESAEALLIEHLLHGHTAREVVDVLVSSWRYTTEGHPRERGDPLVVVKETNDEPAEEPVLTPRRKRRRSGTKAKYAKTYAQMIREAFRGATEKILTTRQIADALARETKVEIPVSSVCATLNAMCKSGEVAHVDMGHWSLDAKGS